MTENGDGLQFPRPMTDDTEGDLNGVPYGLLMWGQGGIFNAVDDRMAITATSDSMVGVVRAAGIRAGTGLNIIVPAGWLALASCDDGTVAVAGSRQDHTLLSAAGPGTGQRIQHVWVNTYPDDARWTLELVNQAQTVGRPGVSLGRVIAGAGQNQASQFTIDRLVPTVGRHADATATPEPGHSGTGFVNMTPDYPIAPTAMRPHAVFRVTAYGTGRIGLVTGAGPQLKFRMTVPTCPDLIFDAQFGTGGLQNWLRERNFFDWEVTGQLQVIQPHTVAGQERRDRVRCMIKGTLSRVGATADAAGLMQPSRTVSGVRTAWGEASNLQVGWQNIQVRAAWGQVASGQWIRAMGSTYEQFLSYHE